jgi:hypothetical protein
MAHLSCIYQPTVVEILDDFVYDFRREEEEARALICLDKLPEEAKRGQDIGREIR